MQSLNVRRVVNGRESVNLVSVELGDEGTNLWRE